MPLRRLNMNTSRSESHLSTLHLPELRASGGGRAGRGAVERQHGAETHTQYAQFRASIWGPAEQFRASIRGSADEAAAAEEKEQKGIAK